MESHKQNCRHIAEQIQWLELFYRDCSHPTENQCQQLSQELGLEPKQIQFWFQNRWTSEKAQNGKIDNYILRNANKMLQYENLVMREVLRKVNCQNCGDSPYEQERHQIIQQLQHENQRLNEKYIGLCTMLANVLGKPVNQIPQLLSPSLGSTSFDKLGERILGRGNTNTPIELLMGNSMATTIIMPSFHNGVQENDKTPMTEMAIKALDELLQLLRIDEPIWIKSAGDPEKYVIHRDIYDKFFPRKNRFPNSNARFESSKDSIVVPINALELKEMFRHPTEWANLFPTMVSKAKTLKTLNNVHLDGTLHLMYKQLHILSPLMPVRDFLFLRYYQQLDSDLWVLVDVSYDCDSKIQEAFPISCWRLPSGCLIQNLPNGKSKVTWVEHVEVDDKALNRIQPLFKDFVFGSHAYGAKLWLSNLQRTCERIAYTRGLSPPHPHELECVINVPEGRRNVMRLGNKLVKNFCTMLAMSNEVDFLQYTKMYINGIVVPATTSIWLPIPCETLFHFFKDEQTRPQWDALLNGNPIKEIAHISYGTHLGNSISILKPLVPNKDNLIILQESWIDQVGALIVYAPTEMDAIASIIDGQNIENIRILASGFTIFSHDHGHQIHETEANNSTNSLGSSSSSSIYMTQPGSVVTIAFQVLVPNTTTNHIDIGHMATVNSLLISTIQRIKKAFNIGDLGRL